MKMFGKIGMKVAGLLMGTLASYHTVGCLVGPTSTFSSRQVDIKMEEVVNLFDFTIPSVDLSSWVESSDTVRQPGMSKAAIVLQKTQVFQRAIFFALLNPQPNGAGFAGVRHPVEFDLSSFQTIILKLRGQGSSQFKIVLKHHGELGDGSPSYEQFFTAPSGEVQELNLPLNLFKPFWRGQPVPDAEPLDISNITSFGIQFYGGVYEDHKQSGPATLEIDWIKASI